MSQGPSIPTIGGSFPSALEAQAANSATSGSDLRMNDPGIQRIGNSTCGDVAKSSGAAATMPSSQTKNSLSTSSCNSPGMSCQYISSRHSSGMVMGSVVPQGLVNTLVMETGTGSTWWAYSSWTRA